MNNKNIQGVVLGSVMFCSIQMINHYYQFHDLLFGIMTGVSFGVTILGLINMSKQSLKNN